jgi:hypothetical protein
MQINWGVKLIIAYSAFVVFMLGMVFLCTRQHYDLVSADYYAQELKYQNVIDGANNTKALKEKVLIAQTESAVNITMPASQPVIEKGEMFFYRPSDARRDFTIPFSTNTIQVGREKLSAGLYKVKITWTVSGKQYFDEQSLYVK